MSTQAQVTLCADQQTPAVLFYYLHYERITCKQSIDCEYLVTSLSHAASQNICQYHEYLLNEYAGLGFIFSVCRFLVVSFCLHLILTIFLSHSLSVSFSLCLIPSLYHSHSVPTLSFHHCLLKELSFGKKSTETF